MAKNFSTQLKAIKKDIIGTIATKVENILKGMEYTHCIEIDGAMIDESDLCDSHITTIEIDNKAQIILTDNNNFTYRLIDGYPSLICLADMADLLTDEEFVVTYKEE